MAGLAGENIVIGGIAYTLDLDDKQFKSGMAGASDNVDSLADRFQKAEAGSKIFAAGLAAIGAAAIGFGIASVKAYQESETASAHLEAVLKSTGGAAGLLKEDLDDQAQALMNLTGVSDEAVTSGQAMLLTFTNIRGGTMQKATDTLLDMATAMNSGVIPNTDELRQQAIQLGKALNDPTDGVTKLTKVGVTFNDEQKKQIETMQKAGDIEGAQAVMLQELQKEFGGSAIAAGQTFTGQMNIAKENFGNFMEIVGEGIVKSLRPLAEGFNNWFKSIGGAQGMMDILTNFMNKIKDNLPLIIGIIIGGLAPAFYALAVATWTAMAPLIPFIAAGAAIGLIAQAIIKHFGGIHEIMQRLQPAFRVMNTIWTTMILPALQSIWNIIKTQLLPALQELWQKIEPVLLPVLKVIGIIIGVVLVAAIMVLVGALWVVSKAITWLIDGASWLWTALSNAFQWIADKVIWFKDNFWFAIGSVLGFFAMLPIKIPIYVWDALVAIVGLIASIDWGNVFSAIGRAFVAVWDAIKGAAIGAWDYIKSINWGEVLVNIGKGLGNAIIDLINGAIHGAFSSVPILKDHIPQIPRFAAGINYVPYDMLAVIHQGEAVVPKKYNPSAGGGGGASITIQAGNIIASDAELRQFVRKLQTAADEVFQLKGASA